jgi:hypothetical protein
LPLDEFKLQVLQRLVIKVELAFEQAVRYAPTPLQHRQSLIDHLFKRHRRLLPISRRTLVALRVPIIPQDIGKGLLMDGSGGALRTNACGHFDAHHMLLKLLRGP